MSSIVYWSQNPEIKQQVSAVRKIALLQSTLVVIYATYNAIFLVLDGLAQVAFIAVLPTIKFLFKRLHDRTASRLPTASTFGPAFVKLFDALHLTKCMQSASSILSSGAVLRYVDLIQNIYHLHNLHRRAQEVKRNLDQVQLNRRRNDENRNSMNKVFPLPSNIPSPISLISSIVVAPSPLSKKIAMRPLVKSSTRVSEIWSWSASTS